MSPPPASAGSPGDGDGTGGGRAGAGASTVAGIATGSAGATGGMDGLGGTGGVTPAAATIDSPAAPPDPAFALLRDKVHGMAAYTPLALGAHLLGAVIVELVHATAPASLRIGWGGAFALLWALRLLLAWHYARRHPRSEAEYRHWLRSWVAGVLASAVLWGAAGWLFYPHDDGSGLQRTVLLLLVYSYCVGSVPVLAPQLPVYLAYTMLQFGPALLRVAFDSRPYSAELATVMAIIWFVIIVLGLNHYRSFNRLEQLKLDAERLMAQLRAEKAAAEGARQEAEAARRRAEEAQHQAEEAQRQAEVANRAKTQFFAAASHDLRQPLHAMGLFAEALRQRSRDDQAIELVNSINASVDALEGLFSELLDITRIDSGGVEVKAADFSFGDVFRRLRLHFEPVAFDKGLELRFRGARHHAHADPLLVERILRNLVSNALRYTEDGGVLVAVRRRGDRLVLQVWDTGVGISKEEQESVFEEFYQVARDAAPTPQQKKGLGLGLAIVRRLAGLMDAPLRLASTYGRGSVFTLELPAAEAPAPAPVGVPAAKAAPGLTLDGRRILVVEDEQAVRHGLEVLLKSWGAEVQSFDTAAAATTWAEGERQRRLEGPGPGPGGSHAGAEVAAAAAAVPPDLLIVDYRLESGATGVQAIEALRACFDGARIPAIVVTGSTMTAHDAEAEKHDFHVMIKPVVPNKLRAMIGFKLGVR